MTATAPAASRPRVSQRDRRQAAERKILDAAVTALVKHGYAGTTTREVQMLAGVPRGVLQHYYPTRSELINAAIRHLYATRLGEVRLKLAQRTSTSGVDEDWVPPLWSVISGPVGRACLDLLVHAQRDVEMSGYLVPLEREFGQANLELCKALLGEQRAAHPRFREFCLVTINSMLGASAGTTVPGSTDEKRMLDAWRQLTDVYFSRE